MRLLMMLTACLGVASAQDTEANMSCVERLEMPVYSPLAHAAHVMGVVTATVAVSAEEQAHVAISPGAHPLLAPSVGAALRASAFKKSCAGKSITVVYKFAIDEAIQTGTSSQRISFRYPNQFWISVPPSPVFAP